MATITLRARENPSPQSGGHDESYRWFVATSLATAICGGFALAIALSIAGGVEAGWRVRTTTLIQVHGQLQLIAFAGIFIAGMALRLMPRFSGRRLAFARLVYPALMLLTAATLVRAVAQPMADSPVRDMGIVASALALAAGAVAFALIVCGTLVTPRGLPNATSTFFVLGALFLVGGSAMSLAMSIDMVVESRAVAPAARQMALVFVWQYGFVVMFIAGVASRAIPTLTGRARPERSAQALALALAAGVTLFAGSVLSMSYREPSDARARAACVGLLVVATALLGVVWLSGVFHPRANRIAPPSRQTFWFVRCAMAWLAVSALLLAWYGARGFADARLPDQFALDAVRHAVALGVMTMMILGIGMLILPEFAGRRLQHPNERALIWALLVAANLAAALRLWPSLEGLQWLESTRYWPMAAAGLLSEAVLIVYAAMFTQSYVEQRQPGWSDRT